LGIYYLTCDHAQEPGEREKGKELAFASDAEALMALDNKQIGMHTPIRVRIDRDEIIEAHAERPKPVPKNRIVRTTVGRLIFNDQLRREMPFYNYPLSQKGSARVIADCHERLGRAETIKLLDRIKELGFKNSTLAGLSFGLTDLRIPAAKPKILEAAQKIVDKVERNFANGVITPME